MWFDEAYSIGLARYPLGVLWRAVTRDEVNGGLFHLLLHALRPALAATGLDELWGARALAGIFGVLTVPALYLVARRAAGDLPALLAALLLAAHRFHVQYSQEARGYTLALLLVVLATGALLSALERPRAGAVLCWAALTGLATWAHLFGILVALAGALAALAHPSIRGARGPAVAARARLALAWGLALCAATSAPVVALAATSDNGRVSWIEPLSLARVAEVLLALAGGVRLLLLPAAGGLVLAALALRRRPAAAFGPALAAAWLLVPLALVVAASALKPLLVARYLLVALPGLLLLCGQAVVALGRPRRIVAAAVLLLLLGLHAAATDPWEEPLWQPFDRVAAHLAAVARPGDGLVVSHPALAVSLDRELGRLGAPRAFVQVDPAPDDPLQLLPGDASPLERRLAGRRGALFVLYAEQSPSAQARRALQASWRVTSDLSFEGVRVLRLEPPADRPR
jgi:mannosyltransferase